MRISLGMLFMVLSFLSFCQDYVEVTVSDKTPRVGDYFSITCTLKNQHEFPASLDSCSFYPARYISSDSAIHQKVYTGVEIIGIKDSSYRQNKETICQREYTVVAWDSCELSLDGFNYSLENKTVESQKVYLNVSFYDPVEGVEMYDIKESFSSWKGSGNLSPIIFWTLLIVASCLFIIAMFFWSNRFLKAKKRVEPLLPLKERILSEINQLYSEELWLNHELQEHFVRFSYLLRMYLTERFQVSFLDKTTYQSKILLKKIDINESTRTKIGELLTASDFVKFADSSISNERIASLKIAIENVLEDTSPNIDQTA